MTFLETFPPKQCIPPPTIQNRKENVVILSACIHTHTELAALGMIIQTWEISFVYSYVESAESRENLEAITFRVPTGLLGL